MFAFLKQKTSQKVKEDLVMSYTRDIENLRCAIVQCEDNLSYLQSRLTHAEKRVLELTLVQPEGSHQ